jgi:hypothetical protein
MTDQERVDIMCSSKHGASFRPCHCEINGFMQMKATSYLKALCCVQLKVKAFSTASNDHLSATQHMHALLPVVGCCSVRGIGRVELAMTSLEAASNCALAAVGSPPAPRQTGR